MYALFGMLPMMVMKLVGDKESRRREVMKAMGIHTSTYWAVEYLVMVLLCNFYHIVFVAAGHVAGLRFFTVNDWSLMMVFLFIWANCLVAMALLLAAMFDSTRTAAAATSCVLFGGCMGTEMIMSRVFSSPQLSVALRDLLQVVPQFALYDGLTCFSDNVVFHGPGVTWSDLSNPGTSRLLHSMLMLCVSWSVMVALAVYFELVLPSATGVKRHPCFCMSWCHPSRWCQRQGQRQRQHTRAKRRAVPTTQHAVGTREHRLLAHLQAKTVGTNGLPPTSCTPAIEAHELRVEYSARGGGAGQRVVAMQSLNIAVRRGECVALLGPNGSGKTSAISAMCGLFEATSGCAHVAGFDMRVDTAKGQQLLGVCPQHNVLWPSLSVEEHMQAFGRFKGLHGPALLCEVEQRLRALRLYDVRDRRAGQCSGGMQRRLCVGMATIGSPVAMVLDEPSTGLDPVARRALWHVARDATFTSGVLLTTHSMDEAEQLSDRIAIVANGQVLAVGTPTQLKAAVGTYVRLSVMALSPDRLAGIEARVLELAPQGTSVLRDAGDCMRQFRIPRVAGVACMGTFVRHLSSEGDALGVSDWALTSMSMQEVFLTIIGGVNRVGSTQHAATHSGRDFADLSTMQATRDDGQQPATPV